MSAAGREPMREQLLDAAEQVFYARGIQAVSMDDLRAAAELPLKRIYQLFPSKDLMVVAFLRRRHDRMMAQIRTYVADTPDPRARVLAIFDYLDDWFHAEEFRGCPWMNAYGELAPTNDAVADEVRHHQREFRQLVTGIVTDGSFSAGVADAIYLLVEGAVAAAGVQQNTAPADEARQAARILLDSDAARY